LVSASILEAVVVVFVVGAATKPKTGYKNALRQQKTKIKYTKKFLIFVSHTQNEVYLLALLVLGSCSRSCCRCCCPVVVYKNSLKCTHNLLYTLSRTHTHTHSHTRLLTHKIKYFFPRFFFLFFLILYMALWLALWHFLPARCPFLLHAPLNPVHWTLSPRSSFSYCVELVVCWFV